MSDAPLINYALPAQSRRGPRIAAIVLLLVNATVLFVMAAWVVVTWAVTRSSRHPPPPQILPVLIIFTGILAGFAVAYTACAIPMFWGGRKPVIAARVTLVIQMLIELLILAAGVRRAIMSTPPVEVVVAAVIFALHLLLAAGTFYLLSGRFRRPQSQLA